MGDIITAIQDLLMNLVTMRVPRAAGCDLPLSEGAQRSIESGSASFARDVRRALARAFARTIGVGGQCGCVRVRAVHA